MKPTVLIASVTAILAVGTAVFVSLPDRKANSGEPQPDEFATAKISQRDATMAREESDEKRPPVLGIRPTPGQPLGAEALQKLESRMPPEHRAALAEARANPTPTPEAEATLEKQLAATRAAEELSEDLRSAVTTFPETWTESYDGLMRDYRAAHFPSPIASSPGTSVSDPEVPTDPGSTGDPVGNENPVAETPADALDVDPEKVARLREHYHDIVEGAIPRRYLIKSPRR